MNTQTAYTQQEARRARAKLARDILYTRKCIRDAVATGDFKGAFVLHVKLSQLQKRYEVLPPK